MIAMNVNQHGELDKAKIEEKSMLSFSVAEMTRKLHHLVTSKTSTMWNAEIVITSTADDVVLEVRWIGILVRLRQGLMQRVREVDHGDAIQCRMDTLPERPRQDLLGVHCRQDGMVHRAQSILARERTRPMASETETMGEIVIVDTKMNGKMMKMVDGGVGRDGSDRTEVFGMGNIGLICSLGRAFCFDLCVLHFLLVIVKWICVHRVV